MVTPSSSAHRSSRGAAPNWSDRDIEELQSLLDRVPAPLEPLDVSMLDGFLCGALVQPVRLPAERWLPYVTDIEGRDLPSGFDASRLHTLARRRAEELNEAIERRQWFDPWVFELTEEDEALDEPDEAAIAGVDAVYPWVAGFAMALELFSQLLDGESPALTAPLALVYRHLDPDDLEDADALREEIDSLEPPADLADAVEGLVRATLLLADVGRPLRVPGAGGAATRAARRPAPSPRKRLR